MKTSLIIPVHSFVDLITNSSSEIFVSADKNTVKAIKKLIENIISASGGTIKVDDLFKFELAYVCYDDNYDEVLMTKEEIKAKRKEVEKIIDNPDKYTASEFEAAETWEFGDDDEAPQLNIRVTVKDPNNANAKVAAEILSDLTSLFNITESYS